jgi:glycosyltransferase involved in cell wall biosynthesis
LVFVHRRGAGAERLRKAARELGIEDRLHILTHVLNTDLQVLYSHAIALCHPSLYEGFGNPIAEAMACACPVVTSNLSAMPEVAGGAALLVNPTDLDALAAAMRRIRQEPSLAAALRLAGLERAKHLSVERFAKANVALYHRLLAGPR